MKLSNKAVGRLVCVAALVCAVSEVSAANLLVNGDFEGGILNGPPTGWGVFQNSPPLTDVTVLNDNGPSAPGVLAADMHNLNPALGLTLKQGTGAGSVVGAGVQMTYSFDVKLLNSALGGVFIAQIFDEKLNGGVVNTPLNSVLNLNGQWQTFSGNWTTTSPLTDFVTVQFIAATGANIGSQEQVRVDNVNISIVPEPTTLALAGLGTAAMLILRRRTA